MKMDNTDVEMFLKYPLISVHIEGTCKLYKGYIRVHNQDLKIVIRKITHEYKMNHFEIEEMDNYNQAKPFLSQLSSDNILNFLDSLCSKLGSSMKPTENLTHIYKRVLHEYNEFTNFFLTLKKCELCKDLTLIKASVADDKNRIHYSEISVDYTQQDKIFKFTLCDLPQSFKPNSSLVELYNDYVSAVEVLQPYFNFMDMLDETTCILDPENPKRANTFRRIWLGDNLSVQITVDPIKLYNRPDLKFLGPDRLVDEYQMKLNSNLENWDTCGNTFENILNILGISHFPQKTATVEAGGILQDVSDCAICFTSRWNNKLPDIICANESCETFYHTECLYEWLMSINSRRIFNEIHGQCLNCEKDIACGIPFTTES